MKFFKRQSTLDFEEANWEQEPDFFIIDQFLDKNLDIVLLAAPCFPNACDEVHAAVGRDGMTVEQIVRFAIYKQHKKLDYRELSTASYDSKICRSFTKMALREMFSYQALQENISEITPEILEKIQIAICQQAIDLGVDDGKKIRTDSTTIKTDIHHPTSASLLWDCIRVSCRLLKKAKEIVKEIAFRNYAKSAKKSLLKIINTKGKNSQEKRRPLFEQMLNIQKRCINQLEKAIELLTFHSFEEPEKEKQIHALLLELKELLPKIQQVSDVAYRREILGEDVAVDEKLFSIFETHTDCISKGSREVVFGHKVNFASGKSNLIFDCIQERGNPSDKRYFPKLLDNISRNFNFTPESIATDGAFASKDNLLDALERGIKNVVFNKSKGSMQNVTTSKKMETILKKWRAGMEAIISNFKRGLNASVCTWKGWQKFKSFVLWNVITFNLRVIAKFVIDKLKPA